MHMPLIRLAKAGRQQLVRHALVPLALLVIATSLVSAEALKPKFGPHAIPIAQSPEYLRAHPAPDYWALSPYYLPQMTNSACSLATIATLVNALRGLPRHAHQTLVTQATLLDAVASRQWAERTVEGGAGVTFEEFRAYVGISLAAYGLDWDMDVLRPADNSPATLERVRALLSENERTDDDIVLVYFNQGVLTGDWDGPHTAPIAAYDAERRRVLVLDVDRQWYVPYWTSDEKLLEAMLRPAPREHGLLADKTGGLIRVTKRREDQPLSAIDRR